MTTLLPEERKMVALKYKSKPFGQMPVKELNVVAYALLLKIQVITGWNIPDEPNDDILVEQLRLKFQESYPTVNPDEFEYAFRNNTQVKDWGKAMNLSLIDEVMIPYLEKRRELSVIEEQKEPVVMIEWKEDTSDKAMNDWLEGVKAMNLSLDLLPVELYDWAARTGKIKLTPLQKGEYLVKAANHRMIKLQASTDPKDARLLSAFMQMKEAGEFTGDEVAIVKNLAKRLALQDYLNQPA